MSWATLTRIKWRHARHLSPYLTSIEVAWAVVPKYSTNYQTRRPTARPSTASQNGPTRTAGFGLARVMRHHC
jgi:hypothetical protein